MPDLLLELFSEEIPARMQKRAAEDLKRLVTEALVAEGLVYEGARAFATPRRLALTVQGLPARSPDRREERKGPRVGAPAAAIDGFLKSAGLSSIDQARIQADKKGDVYVAVIEAAGKPAGGIIAEVVPRVVRAFPWPKSMHWGARSAKPGSLSWVRPLHAILCTFGPETEETEVVAFEIDGIRSGSVTFGHRFMAPGPFTVRRFDDYVIGLEKAKVVLDGERRKQMILADARDRALALGLILAEDEALAEETAGLVEWPVVLAGSFDPSFLDLPGEAVRATIRNYQKCFVLQTTDDRGQRTEAGSNPSSVVRRLSSTFLVVANIEASDGGKAIVAGNERVIRARLADARHFWQTDQRLLPDHDTPAMQSAAERLGLDLGKPLDQRMAKLASTGVIFHEKLGTQGERVERLVRLAAVIADALSSDSGLFSGRLLAADDFRKEQEVFRGKVRRAASLAKADLVTEMVGEFPELQGIMGRYYAAAQGEDAAVATAIEDHYRPLGPTDRVPTGPVAIAVALADKLDALVGFWSVDEKPTGSKDPYALRRAALGVIRIVLENGLRLRLTETFDLPAASAASLLSFFADRLKVQLREQGARHDLVDAVFAPGSQDDLVLIVRRVEALGRFLGTEDGDHLLVGYRRAANILRDEEKKSRLTYDGPVDPRLLSEAEEQTLAKAIDTAIPAASAAVEAEDFEAAMTALAGLRWPVDAFFDKVLVNAPDLDVRANRLRLLNRIREATLSVADFSKVGG